METVFYHKQNDMGTFGYAHVTIETSTYKDASNIREMLEPENLIKLIRERTGIDTDIDIEPNFNIDDPFDETINFEVSSQRVDNVEWQVEQIIEQLKIAVRSKDIKPIVRFQASVYENRENYDLSEQDFEPSLKPKEDE